MTDTLTTVQHRLKPARRARLFDLYRTQGAPDEDGCPTPRAPEANLPPETATQLRLSAIASLSRETPWQQRIFPRNRRGLHRA